MKRVLVGHVCFLLIALCAALAAWWAPQERVAEEVMLWDVPMSDLLSLQYEWPDGRIELVRTGSDADTAFRVLHQAKNLGQESPPSDGGLPQPTHAVGQPSEVAANVATETTTFPAGKVMIRALEALAPLRVRSGLGVPESKSLQAMGLAEPERTLSIEGKTGGIRLDLGVETYGKRGRYLRVQGRPEVYVMPARSWRGLEGSALRLMEAALMRSDLENILAVRVASGSLRSEWMHVHREDAARRYFARLGHEGQADENVDSLVSLIRNLRAREYISEPKPQLLERVAIISFRRTSETDEELEIYREKEGDRVVVKTKGWWANITQPSIAKIEQALALLWD